MHKKVRAPGTFFTACDGLGARVRLGEAGPRSTCPTTILWAPHVLTLQFCHPFQVCVFTCMPVLLFILASTNEVLYRWNGLLASIKAYRGLVAALCLHTAPDAVAGRARSCGALLRGGHCHTPQSSSNDAHICSSSTNARCCSRSMFFFLAGFSSSRARTITRPVPQQSSQYCWSNGLPQSFVGGEAELAYKSVHLVPSRVFSASLSQRQYQAWRTCRYWIGSGSVWHPENVLLGPWWRWRKCLQMHTVATSLL